MVWIKTCAMEERMRFVMAAAENEEALASVVSALRREPQDGLQMA